MRLTRDRASDLGGRAIPTALVLARYDFLSGLQKEFHHRDGTWVNLLGAKQTSADRKRVAMIEKVRTIWITGFLQKSLFQETRIILGLSSPRGSCPAPGPAGERRTRAIGLSRPGPRWWRSSTPWISRY